jgi:ABC-type dipeptide/oligopeptide/nickel transport system permease subunit
MAKGISRKHQRYGTRKVVMVAILVAVAIFLILLVVGVVAPYSA